MYRDYTPVHRLWDALAAAKPGLFFIQIGANDGVTFDPLRPALLKHGWAGILVEPAPAAFQRLQANYAGQPGLTFVNVAIASESGEQVFYRVAGQPGRTDLASSLRADVPRLFAPTSPEGEPLVEATPIPCLTFADLCRQYQVSAVDLLVVDTEGYDFEIIKSIDFARYRPWVILYESEYLSRADKVKCFVHLGRQGYDALELATGWDTLAIRDEARARHPELDRIWRELRSAGGRGRRTEDTARRESPGAVNP